MSDTDKHTLVDLVVDGERAAVLRELALSLNDITLNDHQLCDFELLSVGAFSPLTGYLNRVDYEAVLDRMRLQDGTFWPVPICLDVSKTKAGTLEGGQSVALRDSEGFLLGILHIDDIWPVDKKKEAEQIFGTQDQQHPGVFHLYQVVGDYFIGGTIETISLPLHFDFKQLRLTPRDMRALFKKLGWQRVVGFLTRNAIHKAQFEVTTFAMRQAKANLLIMPIVGMTLHKDVDYYTRVRCYKEVMRYYPPDTMLMSLLPLFMRMAGPREALMHAILFKNYGCSHFIVGYNHANPGVGANGSRFYTCEPTNDFVQKHIDVLGLEIIPFEEMVYLPFEDEYRTLGAVPKHTQSISLSGNDIRDRIRVGKKIPDWASFPEVIEELKKAYPPPKKQGFTIFLTGLSGAGKSTIAKVLYSKILELGDRPVTLLDGDIVRRNLSSTLTFSKEDRDINVRRIGFVASEITKNRGIAICAPIAPYRATRREIRSIIEDYGGFIEVHVATPIQECEKRDRKGMYAKARAGLIKGFTGIDDPYETPQSPELEIDTTHISPDQASQEILLFLGHKGYI